MSLDKNLFKFFHLIFARESLLRTFQKIKCSNLILHGLSLEFGAVKKKENNFYLIKKFKFPFLTFEDRIYKKL